MARIAIVETYPYEAVWGGEAVYLDRIRQFLVNGGHEVETFVTDVTRGRADPRVTLHSKIKNGGHRWHVRHALETGSGHHFAFHPGFIGKALARARGISAPRVFDISAAEEEWVMRRFASFRPQAAILAFGACRFTRRIAASGTPVLASRGFFSDRRIRLGEAPTAPAVDRRMLDEMRDAAVVGFNNAADIDFYAHATGATNGALLGMSFPRRALTAPPADAPVVLFVAARTKPNVESLRWFLDGGWPVVARALPAARLRVVGTVGNAFADDASDSIEIVGFVEDLDREYADAQVVIAPFTLGTGGVKTKVAEALSYGKPLVTTSIGVDPAAPGMFGAAVDVADDPALFGAAVAELLGNDTLRHQRGMLAIEQYERHFSEAAAYAPLIAMLQGVR